MAETLWKLPVPASALLTGPTFRDLGRHQCELSFYIEGESGEERRVALLFEGVEAYKCTYLAALSPNMINLAYGKLVRLGMTPWLREVLQLYKEYYSRRKRTQNELQHLMICFDDGPCYEVICVSFRELNSEEVVSPS